MKNNKTKKQLTTKKKVIKGLGIAGNVLIWCFVAFSVLLTIIVLGSETDVYGAKVVFGKTQVHILSDSMSPTFNTGDLIFIDRTDIITRKQLQVDDVITFAADLDGDGNEELNTHRIVDLVIGENNQTTHYITKGDNAQIKENDAPVPVENVLGKWNGSRVAKLGTAIDWLSSPTGFMICIIIPLVIFFLYELYRFITIIVSLKAKKAISKEDEDAIKQAAIAEYLRQQQEAQNNNKE